MRAIATSGARMGGIELQAKALRSHLPGRVAVHRKRFGDRRPEQ
jgi:hypothetical protein